MEDPYSEGGSGGPHCISQAFDDCESENAYHLAKGSCDNSEVIYQNMHVVGGRDNLFYMPLKIGEMVTLSAMLDSGSMACTIKSAEIKLKLAGEVDECG